MKGAVAFVSGLLFALGLGIGGMTRPSKVIAFLDVTGDWDPSLALVMGGALLVYGVVARFALRTPKPLLEEKFFVPTRRDIDRPLVAGAILFGAGWGLAGYCPGPALVSLASGRASIMVFVAAMLLGMWIEQGLPTRKNAPTLRASVAASALLLALLAVLASRAGATERPDAAARATGRTQMLVSTDWLATHLGEPGLIVLHVGKARDGYDRAHVPGAQLVAFADVAATRGGVPSELPPLVDLTALVRRLGITGEAGERIVIYDEDEGLLAARVYVALDYLGLAGRAALLDGQWAAWRAEQRPADAEQPTAQASRVVPRPDPSRVVARDAVADLSFARTSLPGAHVALVDARPAAQFTGAEPGDGVGRPGHIPGAVNVFWKDQLQGGEVPRLRPADELRALYARAGVVPGDLVVAYCRTGVQAAYTYFVLRYLGYDAHLYDASFVAWSADPDTAVAR